MALGDEVDDEADDTPSVYVAGVVDVIWTVEDPRAPKE